MQANAGGAMFVAGVTIAALSASKLVCRDDPKHDITDPSWKFCPHCGAPLVKRDGG